MSTQQRLENPGGQASGVSRRGAVASGSILAACGAALLAALVAVALVSASGAWSTRPAGQLLVDAVVGITYPLVGTLMLLAGTLARGARALALVLLTSGVAAAAAALSTALCLQATEVTALTRLWSQLQSFLWVPGFLPLLTLVPLLYPDGLPRGAAARWWRWTAYAAATGTALLTAGIALYDESFPGRVTIPKLLTAAGPAQALTLAAAALLLPSAVASLASLVWRYRISRGLARRQVVVLLVAAGTLGLVTALQGAIPEPADVVAQAAAVGLIPLAIGVAVTRHRLYDLDLAVCRALVAASLAACLVGAYITVFALAHGLSGGRSTISAALAAAVAGAVLQPLGRRLGAGVDRLYFGHRSDPYVVTSRLARLLTASDADVAEAPHVVCQVVVEDLRLRGARIRMSTDGMPTLVASVGEHSGAGAARFPLRHRGTTVAWLEVEPRLGESRLHERDLLVLRGVADQCAPALAALRLREELQHSRESLVAARETERRWLRQELHDGLGATLAGLRLQVETAQDLTEDPAVDRLLAAAGD